MIMLHSGVSKENGVTVIGYAIRKEGGYFIILENGSSIEVERETVLYRTFHYIEDYLNFSEQILQQFHSRDAYYLEDLARWSTKELEHIPGIGKARIEYIQKVIHDTFD